MTVPITARGTMTCLRRHHGRALRKCAGVEARLVGGWDGHGSSFGAWRTRRGKTRSRRQVRDPAGGHAGPGSHRPATGRTATWRLPALGLGGVETDRVGAGAHRPPHGPCAYPPPTSSTARSRHGVLRPGERMGANRSAPAVSARRPTSRGSGHGVTVCCFPRSRQGDPVVDEASWRTSGARERNGPPPVAGKRASDMRRGGRI